MKLLWGFVTQQQQLRTSPPQSEIDAHLMSALPDLVILSPIFFGGIRVASVAGIGETVGTSPAWVGRETECRIFRRGSPFSWVLVYLRRRARAVQMDSSALGLSKDMRIKKRLLWPAHNVKADELNRREFQN